MAKPAKVGAHRRPVILRVPSWKILGKPYHLRRIGLAATQFGRMPLRIMMLLVPAESGSGLPSQKRNLSCVALRQVEVLRKQGGMGQFRQWLRSLLTARGGPDRESPFNHAPGDEFANNTHRFRGQKGNAFLWILICWGVMLRLTQYLSNRSLWLDESMLALNIINRTFFQLLKPLDYGQGAPLGFLFLERLAVHVFGTHEYALRLFPFLCGIISLLLFNRLAKLCVTSKAVPIALGLFATSDPLIYYSSEAKQYSSDVAIALSLLSAAIYYESCKLTPWRVAVFGLLGAASIWFSHPSAFILAGVGVSLTSFCLVERQWARIRSFSIAFSFWALSFAICYLFSLRHLSNNGYLLDYWSFGFVPSPLLSVSAVEWFVSTFFGIFQSPVGLELSGLAAFTFLVGCISMLLNKSQKLHMFILMSPVFLTLLAAGFHRYPFAGRLILFIVPTLLLFIAEGAEQIRCRTGGEATIIGACLIGLLFFHPLLFSSYHLIKPRTREEIKPVMNYLKEQKREGDVLYVYHGARPAFRFYAPLFYLDKMSFVLGRSSEDNWGDYEKEIDKLRNHKRVWILFSHSQTLTGVDEKRLFLYLLDRRGTRLNYFESAGAGAYLYDLDEPRSLRQQ